MSPRRTRAATAVLQQPAVSTRSKAQKINNVSQDVAKSAQKIRQSQRKEKPTSVKSNSKASAKKSARKGSPDAEVVFKKSAKKRASRRRLNLDKGAGTEDTPAMQDNRSIDSNESIRILKDTHSSNIPVVELVKYELNVLKDMASEGMSNGKLQRMTSATDAKMSPLILTPKSTLPKISLSPHRSKKTPKKSPISLGSPKTHSIAVSKLFKSPRKLSLASENNLEKLDSDSPNKKPRKSKKDSLGNISNKSLPTSSIAKSKRKKSNNLIVRKFSKSPKIVLKSPKLKKSKSRKLKLLSPSRMTKSPLETSPRTSSTTPNRSNSKSPRISTNESPLPERKNLSAVKRRLLDSRLTKILSASQMKDVLAEPLVLLEKLSPECMRQQNMLRVAGKNRSATLIKVESPLISVGSNSKISIKRASAGSDVSANRSSSTKLRNSSMEKSTNRISPRIKYDASVQKKNRPHTSLTTSTPRVEKMGSTDTSLTSNISIVSVNNASLNRLRHRNQSDVQLSSTSIENISKPSMFDEDISNISDKSVVPTSSIVKSKRKTSNNLIVRKFSKSPKIVLKSSKSKESKSRKLSSPSGVRKSPLKMSPRSPSTTPNRNNSKSPRISTKGSPLPKRKNSSTIERRESTVEKKEGNNTYELEQPQTLSLRRMMKKRTSTDANLTPRDNNAKKGKVHFADVIPGAGSAKKSMNKLNGSRSSISHNVSAQRRNNIMNSAHKSRKVETPKFSRNSLISPFKKSSPRTHGSIPIVQLSGIQVMSKSFASTEKKSDVKPVAGSAKKSMNELNGSRSSISHNVSAQRRNNMNSAYKSRKVETPKFSRNSLISSLKRSSPRTHGGTPIVQLSGIQVMSKSFASTEKKSDIKPVAGSAKKSMNKLNGSRSSISHNVSAQRRSNIMNSIHKSRKVETPKVSRNALISSFKRSSPRTHEGTPRPQLSGIQVMSKSFASTEKKSEVKSSMKKKMPNFARIHEQMFAKSESLVDAKNRLKTRHLAFTANKAVPKANVKKEEKKPLPTDTKDGVHNRFGFKLKKAEATHVILKKQTVFSRQKQQHETRMMLKSVRTNRRFELQMKTRNLKS